MRHWIFGFGLAGLVLLAQPAAAQTSAEFQRTCATAGGVAGYAQKNAILSWMLIADLPEPALIAFQANGADSTAALTNAATNAPTAWRRGGWTKGWAFTTIRSGKIYIETGPNNLPFEYCLKITPLTPPRTVLPGYS